MTKRTETQGLVSNHHNVFILGAGYSADRGLPLIRGFTDSMRDALESTRDAAALEAISRVMEYRQQAAAAAEKVRVDLENIEDLFSLATLSPARDVVASMPLAIAATIAEAESAAVPPQRWLRFPNSLIPDLPKAWQASARTSVDGDTVKVGVSLYDLYWASALGMLSPRNPQQRTTIISFNYDTLVEDALRQLGVPFSYGLSAAVDSGSGATRAEGSPSPGTVEVLKLHGSMNWAPPQSKPSEGPNLFANYRELREADCVPSIVPPTWGKSIPEFMSEVWSKARAAIACATRIAVIGHSLRRTDAHFRYLLAEGLGRNISLRQILFVGQSSNRSGDGGAEATEMDNNARDLIQDPLWSQRRVGFCFEGATTFLTNNMAHNGWVQPRHQMIGVSDRRWD